MISIHLFYLTLTYYYLRYFSTSPPLCTHTPLILSFPEQPQTLLSHTHTHTHTHTHIHTHTLSLSLSFSHTHTHTHTFAIQTYSLTQVMDSTRKISIVNNLLNLYKKILQIFFIDVKLIYSMLENIAFDEETQLVVHIDLQAILLICLPSTSWPFFIELACYLLHLCWVFGLLSFFQAHSMENIYLTHS